MPLTVEACRVNWLTTMMSPPTSCTERFITPFSSLKIRMRTILPLSHSMSWGVSASLDAQKDKQTGADRGGEHSVGRYTGTGDALDDSSHVPVFGI